MQSLIAKGMAPDKFCLYLKDRVPKEPLIKLKINLEVQEETRSFPSWVSFIHWAC